MIPLSRISNYFRTAATRLPWIMDGGKLPNIHWHGLTGTDADLVILIGGFFL